MGTKTKKRKSTLKILKASGNTLRTVLKNEEVDTESKELYYNIVTDTVEGLKENEELPHGVRRKKQMQWVADQLRLETFSKKFMRKYKRFPSMLEVELQLGMGRTAIQNHLNACSLKNIRERYVGRLNNEELLASIYKTAKQDSRAARLYMELTEGHGVKVQVEDLNPKRQIIKVGDLTVEF